MKKKMEGKVEVEDGERKREVKARRIGGLYRYIMKRETEREIVGGRES